MDEKANPWYVTNLDEFMYFCCPECDERNHYRDSFLEHALKHHPNAKEGLEKYVLNPDIQKEEIEKVDYINQIIKCEIKDELEDITTNNDDFYENNDNIELTKNDEVHEKNFKCDLCEKSYSRSDHLKRHVQNIHQNENSNNDFNEIDNDWQDFDNGSYYYEESTKSFKKLNRYPCNLCEKSFPKPRLLKRHVDSVHEGIKNFKCNFCEKAYSRSDHLKRHVQSVHQNEDLNNDFNEIAKKEITKNEEIEDSWPLEENAEDIKYEDVNEYNQSFYEEKNKIVQQKPLNRYSCDLCGKSFPNPSKVKRHVDSVHEGIKNFKCDVCEKTFSRSEHRDSHVRNVHRIFNKSNADYDNEIIKTEDDSLNDSKLDNSDMAEKHNEYIKNEITDEDIKTFECDFCDKSFGEYRGVDIRGYF